VYVTHDQREALALADRIVVMQMGEVLQIGDPVGLYNKPASNTVAEFLGYSNIFDVELIGRDDVGCEIAFLGDGRRLRAAAGPANGAEALCVCVRPDDVRISRLAEAGTANADLPQNAFRGEVTLASFMGSQMQYRVRV